MISISMFNNKGGVGKTTLTCNIASHFAIQHGKKVLVIDCDPQCNSTQLIMGENFTTDLYLDDEFGTRYTTIGDVLRPIEDGDANIDEQVKLIPSASNRFKVDLLPGHPSFSSIEDRLSAAWHDLKSGDVGGIRKTNWNTRLCEILSDKYDFIFFDLGPSLGSINRSVLVGCDHFITPMGTDIFSILGIRNIAEWLRNWIDEYYHSIELCTKENPNRLDGYHVKNELPIEKGYVGYTVQQYITKSKQGDRRPTKAYEDIIKNVPAEIEKSLGQFFIKNMTLETCKLGDIPHLYSLIPLAQSVSAPILDLKAGDGLVGSQFSQREQYGLIIGAIVDKIKANLDKKGV